VTIGENFTLSRTSEVAAPDKFLENVLQFNPSLPVYTKDGDFAGPVGGYPDRENPLARLNRNKDNKYVYWRIFGNAFIDINPVKGLHIRTTAGIDYAQKRQRIFTYPITEGTMANDKNAVESERFFDLVRWGEAEKVINKYYAEEADNCAIYSEAHFTANKNEYLPIPFSQISASNGHYTQNIGGW